MSEKRLAYLVQQTLKTDRGYQVCIAKEGEPGYYPTDWYWNCTFEEANKLCDDQNALLGITPEEATKIVLSSMFHKKNKRS